MLEIIVSVLALFGLMALGVVVTITALVLFLIYGTDKQ
jgi:uncharacterized membrane protein YsdA (DUF1294 family)